MLDRHLDPICVDEMSNEEWDLLMKDFSDWLEEEAELQRIEQED